MNKNFSSDKPISDQALDKFQRYEFAKRIATMIGERENEDCIVIGLYGAWGEGKTSVVNFIEQELKKDEKVVAIKFNAWRYSDEMSLLSQFFGELAKALNASLKHGTEKIGELIGKYGKLINSNIPIVKELTEGAKGAGQLMAEVPIEELRKRIEKILQEGKAKVVVFIDDIDRLEKKEIQAIFRLVKLTGDFSNVTYVLSFDEKMVASALADIYGGGQNAGRDFLEKIIQVPLTIPQAQPEALQEFCFDLLNKTFDKHQLQLTEQEGKRFVNEFSSNVLLSLDTPRLAVQYSNSLSFSMPLLSGEVNIVDLMLVEAIKIFYPKHYEFIKANPNYFLGSYSQKDIYSGESEKKKAIKKHLDDLSEGLLPSQKDGIFRLLSELFPRLDEAFGNYVHTDANVTEWFRLKRIVSPQYFKRYFSYSVIKGEVSDVTFDEFLATTPNNSIEQIVMTMNDIIANSSPSNFIQKLRTREDILNWETASKISEAIAKSSTTFPKGNENSFSYGFESVNAQSAIFIYQILKKHGNKEERFEFAKKIMNESDLFQFAYDLNNWCRSGETPDEKIFTDAQYTDLAKLMVERAKNESGEIPIFEKFKDVPTLVYLFAAWAEFDKEGLNNYVSEVLEKTPNKVIELLNSFTPTAYSSGHPSPFKTDFEKERYNWFITIFDKNLVAESIRKCYTEEILSSESVRWLRMWEHDQTDVNIARQFLHWDEASKTTEPAT
jgi:predicted KAP-like P-loop ATPase